MARLESIEIKDLFERKGFNHKIEFNEDPGMKIIVGANGFGKTTILKMINGLLSFDLSIFFSVRFTSVKFVFSDDIGYFKFIEISQEITPSGKVSHLIRFDNKKEQKYCIDSINFYENEPFADFLATRYMDEDLSYQFSRRPIRITKDNNQKLYLALYKFLHDDPERYRMRYKYPFGSFDNKGIKYVMDNLHIISSIFSVHFISADRLFSREARPNEGSRREISNTPMVAKNNEDLLQRFDRALVRTTQKSQELDNSFPYRIIKKINRNQKTVDFDSLQNRLDDIKQRRHNLINYGLLDNFANPIDSESMNSISSENRNYVSMVLDEYIKDSEKKLSILEEEAERVRLLQEIIDKRFLFKKMKVDKKNGMQFLPTDQENRLVEEGVIPLESLSSGEQHELILFYKLLFQVEENSLVLIDEPELSLHVSWQKYFVDDAIEIANKNHFNIIIATHSPQIVINHFDLAENLSGVE